MKYYVWRNRIYTMCGYERVDVNDKKKGNKTYKRSIQKNIFYLMYTDRRYKIFDRQWTALTITV